MLKAQKTKVIDELKTTFAKSKGIFMTDFRGMPVADITALRFELKKSKTDYKVIKNRIALRALEQKDADALKPHFDYMTAVALSFGDPSATAKALTKMAETNPFLKIKGAYLDGKVISLAEVKALSKLPSRPELLAKLLGTFVAVPTGFVRVLNGVPQKFVYLLEALRKQKEGGS